MATLIALDSGPEGWIQGQRGWIQGQKGVTTSAAVLENQCIEISGSHFGL
jgi:hypothetical protein